MSLVSAFVRMLLAMGVVCVLLYGSARVMRARNGLAGPALRLGGARPARGRSQAIELVGRQSVGRMASVAVLHVGDRELVVGITDTQVNLLSERPMPRSDTPLDLSDRAVLEQDDDMTQPAGRTPGSGPARTTLLEQLKEQTVRRR